MDEPRAGAIPVPPAAGERAPSRGTSELRHPNKAAAVTQNLPQVFFC